MNMIDKLNQEFDVIMEKNIQLEKEKLELYKDDFKKRSTSGSPDDADALAMCYGFQGPGVGVW